MRLSTAIVDGGAWFVTHRSCKRGQSDRDGVSRSIGNAKPFSLGLAFGPVGALPSVFVVPRKLLRKFCQANLASTFVCGIEVPHRAPHGT